MFLLDTNACIAVIKNAPSVRSRLEKVLAEATPVYVSSVVAYELWYGVAKSARPESNAHLVDSFLSGLVSVLSFDLEDAKAAGTIRAALEEAGKPIGAYDLLIAGQALRRGLTLVTANVKEFSRIRNLDWEDWGR